MLATVSGAGNVLRRMSPRRWSALAASLSAVGYVYAVSPEIPGRYLPCPSFILTGTYCPGCGGLRSAHALMHGDLVLSLQRNPLVLPLLIVLVVGGVVWWRRGRPVLRIDPAGWRFRLTMVGIALFWIARNLPGLEWLAPT